MASCGDLMEEDCTCCYCPEPVVTEPCCAADERRKYRGKRSLLKYFLILALLAVLFILPLRDPKDRCNLNNQADPLSRFLCIISNPVARLRYTTTDFIRQVVQIIVDFFNELYVYLFGSEHAQFRINKAPVVIKSVEQPVRQPVDLPIRKPYALTAEQPAGPSTEYPVPDSYARPVKEPIEDYVKRPVEQVVSKLVEQPVSKPVGQLDEQPVSKPVGQPVEKPAKPAIEQIAETSGITTNPCPPPHILEMKIADSQRACPKCKAKGQICLTGCPHALC